jgi:hypothetical protein
MTILRPSVTLLAIGSTALVACAEEVKYYAEIQFEIAEADLPAPLEGHEIRVNICLDPLVKECHNLNMEAAWMVGEPGRGEQAGEYRFPLAGTKTTATFVVRPESQVGGFFYFRAWVSDTSSCCGTLCSEDFLDPQGQLLDSTRIDRVNVPQQVRMSACPAAVACPGLPPCTCSCDVRNFP